MFYNIVIDSVKNRFFNFILIKSTLLNLLNVLILLLSQYNYLDKDIRFRTDLRATPPKR